MVKQKRAITGISGYGIEFVRYFIAECVWFACVIFLVSIVRIDLVRNNRFVHSLIGPLSGTCCRIYTFVCVTWSVSIVGIDLVRNKRFVHSSIRHLSGTRCRICLCFVCTTLSVLIVRIEVVQDGFPWQDQTITTRLQKQFSNGFTHFGFYLTIYLYTSIFGTINFLPKQ